MNGEFIASSINVIEQLKKEYNQLLDDHNKSQALWAAKVEELENQHADQERKIAELIRQLEFSGKLHAEARRSLAAAERQWRKCSAILNCIDQADVRSGRELAQKYHPDLFIVADWIEQMAREDTPRLGVSAENS